MCEDWGLPVPRIYVSDRLERWTFVVSMMFDNWQYLWETGAREPAELMPELFDDMAERWAVDNRVRIAEEL